MGPVQGRYGPVRGAVPILYWGNKEWLAVHYGEFEEARGWVILNNALAPRSASALFRITHPRASSNSP